MKIGGEINGFILNTQIFDDIFSIYFKLNNISQDKIIEIAIITNM
jgi:hypothetical protein